MRRLCELCPQRGALLREHAATSRDSSGCRSGECFWLPVRGGQDTVETL